MNKRFIGEKLLITRSFRGMTQKEMAEEVVAPVPLISYLEKGQRMPSEDLVEAIGQVLGFEPAFFYEPLHDEFIIQNCNFRHISSTSEKLKKRIVAQCSLLSIIITHLKSMIDFPEYSVPNITVKNNEDIEEAARECRKLWELDLNAPIDNMIRVLENAGVITHRHKTDTAKIDAFSRYGENTMVILNDYKQSASRSVWDCAHELGHLVMHQDTDLNLKEREKQADKFASEFLLSKIGFTREYGFRNKLNWDHLFNLKERWGTSVASIIRRAYDLKLIDAIQYRRGYKYIRAKGWHKGEPREPEQEKPELLNIAFEELEKEYGKKPIDVAKTMQFHLRTFEEVTGINIPEANLDNSHVTSINDYFNKF